jgi:hypothetical protein
MFRRMCVGINDGRRGRGGGSHIIHHTSMKVNCILKSLCYQAFIINILIMNKRTHSMNWEVQGFKRKMLKVLFFHLDNSVDNCVPKLMASSSFHVNYPRAQTLFPKPLYSHLGWKTKFKIPQIISASCLSRIDKFAYLQRNMVTFTCLSCHL